MDDGKPGLFDTLRGLAASGLELLRVRVELVAVETEEFLGRLAVSAAMALIAILSAAFALLFAAVFIILLLWDEHRLLATAGVAAGFALLSVLLLLILSRRRRTQPRWLGATATELRKDLDAIGSTER